MQAARQVSPRQKTMKWGLVDQVPAGIRHLGYCRDPGRVQAQLLTQTRECKAHLLFVPR